MKISKTSLVSSVALLPLIALAYSVLGGTGGAATAAPQTERAGSAEAQPLTCHFEPNQHGAFRLESSVHDTRAPAQEDRLTGVLSWQVAENLSATRWRLRAALANVEHGQSLTRPEERVSGSLDAPFFIDVDAACRFVGFGFDRRWSPRKRQLVQTAISTWEHVLPADPTAKRWRVEQRDGMGAYEASYERLPGRGVGVQRTKAAYKEQDTARTLGLTLQVLGARSTARFDSGWLLRAGGRERMRIEASGSLQADLVQRFSVVKDDARFTPVPPMAADDADFGDAFAMAVDRTQQVDSSLQAVPFEKALSDFVRLLEQADTSFAAARQLAAWLRANPDKAQRVLVALRAERVPEKARPALFLALELSGHDQSRRVLSSVLEDTAFSPMDRARAASALSDIGEPKLSSAEQLAAKGSEEGMVGNVSLLGLGNLGSRSQTDDVRDYVRTELTAQLDDAQRGRKNVVLDAIGNSGDPGFADRVSAEFDSEDPVTRRHAARALGRMAPSVSSRRLLDQLEEEPDADTRTAIVKALKGAKATDALVTTMSSRLATSSSKAERRAIIDWLGAALSSQPAARDALVAHFRVETDARLKQLIGTFLPASALR